MSDRGWLTYCPDMDGMTDVCKEMLCAPQVWPNVCAVCVATCCRGFPIVTVWLDSASGGNQVLSLYQEPYHAPRTYMVGLPFPPDMYCNDWSEDPQDSSWWIPVALQIAVRRKIRSNQMMLH